MKEIGQCFKEARESIELSKEEVLRDLNITESQLDNLEDGNANAFKDIFFLKDLIRKYAVYLNLDEDEIMDKFNDFIFGYTSRIPINDIYICALIFMVILIVLIIHFIKNSSTDNLSVIFDEFERRF